MILHGHTTTYIFGKGAYFANSALLWPWKLQPFTWQSHPTLPTFHFHFSVLSARPIAPSTIHALPLKRFRYEPKHQDQWCTGGAPFAWWDPHVPPFQYSICFDLEYHWQPIISKVRTQCRVARERSEGRVDGERPTTAEKDHVSSGGADQQSGAYGKCGVSPTECGVG
jgi:hypothetical protein